MQNFICEPKYDEITKDEFEKLLKDKTNEIHYMAFTVNSIDDLVRYFTNMLKHGGNVAFHIIVYKTETIQYPIVPINGFDILQYLLVENSWDIDLNKVPEGIINDIEKQLEALRNIYDIKLKPVEYTEKTSHKYFSVFNLLKPYLFGGDTK